MANACNVCKDNGFDNQPISIKPDLDATGKQKTYNWNGQEKKSWLKFNPDGSVHEHKKKASNVATNAADAYSGNELKSVTTTAQETRSPDQYRGVDDSPDFQREEKEARQEYFKRREEKYDQNIAEYKQHQKNMETKMDQIDYNTSAINIRLEKLEQIESKLSDISNKLDSLAGIQMLLNSILHPNPSIHFANELVNNNNKEAENQKIEDMKKAINKTEVIAQQTPQGATEPLADIVIEDDEVVQ